MSNTWTILWHFDTAQFRVELARRLEAWPDLSWDDTGETRAKFESGEWGCYAFRVRVLCLGHEIAAEYLGNSIYADPAEFRGHFGSYFYDMVKSAIAEARRTLASRPYVRVA